MSFILITTLIVLMLLLLIILNYFYNYFLMSSEPLAWKEAIKKGEVTCSLRKLKKRYPFKIRFYTWWLQNERLKAEKIPGAFAEVGVYKGESAAILHALDPDRELHLFDTFSGFPASDLEGETGEASTYTTENFADVSLTDTIKRVAGKDNIHVHKGYFPDTASGLEVKRFALVNLDADLYKPTRAALEFFYPSLSPGGVIFIHDYNHKWPGIIKAVNEFARKIPESIVLMPDADGTVLIVKNK